MMGFRSTAFMQYRYDVVRMLPPHSLGVYGLANRTSWLYIGKGIVRDRLLAHLRGDNPLILPHVPTQFVVEFTTDIDRREKELIYLLDPLANRRVG